jgi:hypothetical protein
LFQVIHLWLDTSESRGPPTISLRCRISEALVIGQSGYLHNKVNSQRDCDATNRPSPPAQCMPLFDNITSKRTTNAGCAVRFQLWKSKAHKATLMSPIPFPVDLSHKDHQISSQASPSSTLEVFSPLPITMQLTVLSHHAVHRYSVRTPPIKSRSTKCQAWDQLPRKPCPLRELSSSRWWRILQTYLPTSSGLGRLRR